MYRTTAQRHYQPCAVGPPAGPKPYWGWSHRNQRMEFMDFPSYLDSVRQGYDTAYGGLVTGLQQLGWPAGAVPGPYAPSAGPVTMLPGRWEPGAWHERRHGHHRHRWHGAGEGDRRGCGCGCGHGRDRDCECRRDRECRECEHGHGHDRECRDCEHGCGRCGSRCDCCVVDADIVVYGHCGEVRVVPIEIDNDSRKARENVEIQVSEVRSGGGRELAWPVLIQPQGPLTLEPCRTTRLELLVHITCGEASRAASDGNEDAASHQDAAAEQEAPADAFAALAAQREHGFDVERCEVGYTTVRLEGCLVRPIVVAIAALPLGCESYRVGCSCSCCC